MKVNALVAGLMALGLLAGCNSSSDNVQEARKDLQDTKAKAVSKVDDAKLNAEKKVNDAKSEAASDIAKKQNEVVKAENKANRETVSGTTSGAAATAPAADAKADTKADAKGKVAVTEKECAALAKEKSIKTEDKEKYEACSKMKKK